MTCHRLLNSRAFLILSCLCLIVQLAFLQFIFRFLSVNHLTNSILRDVETLNELAERRSLYFCLFDSYLLSRVSNTNLNLNKDLNPGQTLRFAVDAKLVRPREVHKLLSLLREEGFEGQIFYNEKPVLTPNSNWTNAIPVAIIAKRVAVLYVLLLYTRESNTWWYGSISNDPYVLDKLDALNLKNDKVLPAFLPEGILNKFETSLVSINGNFHRFIRPTHSAQFLKELNNSHFIECNVERAKSFIGTHGTDKSLEAVRFKHKAWKLLSKVTTVLDGLSVPFWISSGTCLGYFRECDIIPYSRDVDIGIFAEDFTLKIISNLKEHNILLKLWFGELQDSLELSFVDQSNTKLDIFFFYKEDNYFWNGGTQARTGKKFKYIFPKFEICWTLFLGLKLRVPCDTEAYIVSNYGPHWYTPVVDWDWKSSPFNVQENGVWPKSKLNSVVKQFFL